MRLDSVYYLNESIESTKKISDSIEIHSSSESELTILVELILNQIY